MKKQSAKLSSVDEATSLLHFSETVGDFIRYWGFRRIHGQIWTLVYLSKAHLNGAEITERLGVSKALVSPALAELEEHGLIVSLPDGLKVKRYKAKDDVISVIKNVLKKREAVIIATAQKRFKNLQSANRKINPEISNLEKSRVDELGKMIDLASFALTFLVGQLKVEPMDKWIDVAEKF